ncbi:MAG: cell division protein ZapA [Synergistaceae bacterium]
MDEAPEIRNLGDGKYSFLVGRQRYTLTTALDEERFVRIVSAIQELVSTFPPTLSQEERLFLALMSFSHELDDIKCRIDSLIETLNESGSDN